MSNEPTHSATLGPLSFPEALTVAFIALRLAGFIHWPWLWVISPLWITVAVALVVGIVLAVVAVLKAS